MLVAERGAANNTVDAYRRDLKDYFRFIKESRTSVECASVTDVRKYLKVLSSRGLATSTSARRLSTVRQFHRFLLAEGLSREDPSTIIDSPRGQRLLPKILTENDINNLLDGSRFNEEPGAVRLRALLELLYATGMRVSELVALPLSATLMDKNYLLIRGKGNKERIVPLTASAREALYNYQLIREKKFLGSKSSTWLFPSRGSSHHLTRQRFGQLLKAHALRCGIETARVSPHIIRHAFASHLLAGGVDLRVLQQMLGHVDISTTQIYTHVLDERMRHLVETAHPLSKLNIKH